MPTSVNSPTPGNCEGFALKIFDPSNIGSHDERKIRTNRQGHDDAERKTAHTSARRGSEHRRIVQISSHQSLKGETGRMTISSASNPCARKNP